MLIVSCVRARTRDNLLLPLVPHNSTDLVVVMHQRNAAVHKKGRRETLLASKHGLKMQDLKYFANISRGRKYTDLKDTHCVF